MEKSRESSGLYELIYRTVRQIPKGKVATYVQVARLCGLREHARLVGYALHNLKPSSGVPWQRVVNSKGMISLRKHTAGHERQRKLLELEGIMFDGDKIDLSRYGVLQWSGNQKMGHSAKRKACLPDRQAHGGKKRG